MDYNTFYLIAVIVLFILAISDLIVGVSNDAVNFLNAAVGSKAATFKTIMIFAALGVFVGAVFSTGMMEVARKGIFHPEFFSLNEIMIIFLAVMLTDVIMLDLFNTFGMPTSTTVSIVFELLGAAVALSIIKIYSDPNALSISEYINSAKALAIISGILLSVVIAFTTGLIIQYISRFIFTFQYEKQMKYFGALFGGIAIAIITYFILIKGAKHAAFMTDELKASIKTNTFLIIVSSFIFWTVILQILYSFFKINILKIIVLIGTFALGLAFAGNDLVNFIGVPIAGYSSYLDYLHNGAGVDPGSFLMTNMAGQVQTPGYLLVLAGLIMVVTLSISSKAKNVIKTSVDLGSQVDIEEEKFSPSLFSSGMVRGISKFFNNISKAVPPGIRKSIVTRFDQTYFNNSVKNSGQEAPSFDLIRAAVTLMVASVLITIGTNFKLPLSTTYVTFMVFMGASLADGAWGRESAVYRVSGVLSVIGGWFFTALIAFISAFIMAFIIYYGGVIGLLVLIIIAGYLIYHTYTSFNKKKKEKESIDHELEITMKQKQLSSQQIYEKTLNMIDVMLEDIPKILETNINGLDKEDLKLLNKAKESNGIWHGKTKKMKSKIRNIVEKLSEKSVYAGNQYVRIVENLRDLYYSTQMIVKPSAQHVTNYHKPFTKEQIKDLYEINNKLNEYFEEIKTVIKNPDSDNIASIKVLRNEILDLIEDYRKIQLKRIKKAETGVRTSMLYIDILSEYKNMLLLGYSLVKIIHEFETELNLEKENDLNK
ncbi:MAG TPA: phosphate permease [Bacteroidetes bacterium]|nr:phosphate permease [Bacteroidota bacterium]